MQMDIYIVSAFTAGTSGGNLAGVVLDADRLSPLQKQKLATHIALSETAFVSNSVHADFKLEFFTPTRQIAQCGHATIATFGLLKQLNLIGKEIISVETIDDTRTVFVSGSAIAMEQQAPVYQDLSESDLTQTLAAMGLTTHDLADQLRPRVVSTGNAFLVMALNSVETLHNIQPNFEALRAISDRLGLVGFYPFTRSAQSARHDASTRMFAPSYGIHEEAATGMAAGSLAGYFYDFLKTRKRILRIEQGYLMPQPSPSLITVKLNIDDGKINTLLVGGHTNIVRHFQLTVEDFHISGQCAAQKAQLG